MLGSPAIPLREQRRVFQMIARLPEMNRQLRELTAQVALLTAGLASSPTPSRIRRDSNRGGCGTLTQRSARSLLKSRGVEGRQRRTKGISGPGPTWVSAKLRERSAVLVLTSRQRRIRATTPWNRPPRPSACSPAVVGFRSCLPRPPAGKGCRWLASGFATKRQTSSVTFVPATRRSVCRSSVE